MSYKISLNGDLGGGKSTVAALFIQRYPEFSTYSTGVMMREMAQKAGLTIEEFNKKSESDGSADTLIDNGLKALSDDPRNLIIDSRMAWHFVKDTFKVYLSCDAYTAAARIMAAGRETENFTDIKEAVRSIKERRESEKKRYTGFYGADITDMNNYDLILDTTFAKPETVLEYMAFAFENWKATKETNRCYMAPERLYYNSLDVDMDEAEKLSVKIENEETVEDVTLFSEDGNFYIDRATNSALAYSICGASYVPARIVKGTVPKDRDYVQMKTSL